MAKPSLPAASPTKGILDILNKQANRATRTSPRKRPDETSENQGSPSKRQKLRTLGATTETRPQLQKKQREVVQSLLPLKRTRTSEYDLPETDLEESENEEHQSSTAPSPLKLRPMKVVRNGRPIAEGSIDLPPDAGFSPAKATKDKRRPVTPSLHCRATEDGSNRQKKGVGRPRKSRSGEQKHNGTIKPVGNVGGAGHEPNAEQAEQQDENDEDYAEEVEDSEDSNDRKESRPAKPRAEPELELEPKASPRKRSKMKTISAEKKNQEAERVAFWGTTKFRDFEEQANLHGCRTHWEKMLKAARMNRDTVVEPATATVQKFEKLVKSAQLAMKEAEEEKDGPDREELEDIVFASLKRVEKACSFLRPTNDAKINSHRVQDLYTVAIPSLVFLIKSQVSFHFEDETLSSEALGEISNLMKATLEVCHTASHWRPRPTGLEQGVLGDTKNAIIVNISRIQKVYSDAKEAIDRPYRQQAKREKLEKDRRELAEKQLRDAEGQRQELRERYSRQNESWARRDEDLRSRQRSRPPDRSNQRARQLTADEILDVDDLEFEDILRLNSNAHDGNESRSAVSRGKLPERPRPRFQRERTEDIPGPSQTLPKWTRIENEALLAGLEIFTGSDRFERILNVYGSVDIDGRLASRDLDELMQQAKFFKQSSAALIAKQEELGNNWNWLKSVPG